jgi:hypothetical protein
MWFSEGATEGVVDGREVASVKIKSVGTIRYFNEGSEVR